MSRFFNNNYYKGEKNQALKAQLFTVNAMAQQTQAIINALKPATTTGA